MRKSAGILLYRLKKDELEFLLVHPGGPFWANKDQGAWSIPKGEYTSEEDPLDAAIREFEEETGFKVKGKFIPLTSIKQKGGKQVMAWAVEGDLVASDIKSNTFKLQWPPKSGKWISVPEVDKADWFDRSAAKEKIISAQYSLIDELIELLIDTNNKNV